MNVIVWSKDGKGVDTTLDLTGVPAKGDKVVSPDGKEHNVLEVAWSPGAPPRVQIADVWMRG